jgi:WD40 repeat protein
MAVGMPAGGVALWDLADRRHPTPLADIPMDGTASKIVFSPDGRTVAVAAGRTVDLWRLAGRSDPVRLGTLKGHSDKVMAMAFSPDGRTLATGSRDTTAALWNVADEAALRRKAILTDNGAAVGTVAFSPDGHTLVIGTGYRAAAFWDVADLSGPVRVATLKRADLKTESLVFHPDGRTLITSGQSFDDSATQAVLWNYSALNELRANPTDVACTVSGGGLTPDDWATYIPEVPYQPTCPR